MRKPTITLVIVFLFTLSPSGVGEWEGRVFGSDPLTPTPLPLEKGERGRGEGVDQGNYADVVVFSADGAGNFHGCSRSMRLMFARERIPIRIEVFDWSHGNGRVLADQMAFDHAKQQGRRMADTVTDFCRKNPGKRVFLMGHSAGTTVALIAASVMPPDLVEGMVLLAPSLSADYDLRPALRNVRGHIDVFYSHRDWWYLGVATRLVGTSDRLYSPTSGRIGFRPLISTPEDAELYAKLRQRRWDPSDRLAGNLGGHYGAYQPEFVRLHILPLLLGQKSK